MRPLALSPVLGRKGMQKEREESPHPQEAGPSLGLSKREQSRGRGSSISRQHRKVPICSSDHSDSQGELAYCYSKRHSLIIMGNFCCTNKSKACGRAL